MGLTKMLATKRLPCLRAASIRLTCPACRLPIVGTNTTRSPSACQRPTWARTWAMVVAVSIDTRRASSMELVLRRRIRLLLHGLDIAFESIEIGAGAIHEILDEARLAARGDVEHVIQHENLPVGVRPRADADDRHVERVGDLL